MEPILQSIFECAVDGIIVIDANGRIKAFNPAAERLFGYSAEEVLGENVKMLMPSPDRERHDRYLATYLETGIARIIGTGREVRGRRKDGSTFPLHLSVGEMRLDGEPALTGILHDLSRRVQIEEALRKSEEHLRSIVESAVDAIIVIDDRGLIEAFNPSAERLFGYTTSEVIGRNVNMLMPNPDREQHDGYIRHYLATGEHKIIGIGREVRALKKDGTRFPVHLSVGEMVSEGKRSFTGILHDLSDRVTLEQRLAEQRSLAKLGEMAAVVAHEVKKFFTTCSEQRRMAVTHPRSRRKSSVRDNSQARTAAHGRGLVGHLLMGSVAEKVVRIAPCPVLTVRHPEHEFIQPDALEAAGAVKPA